MKDTVDGRDLALALIKIRGEQADGGGRRGNPGPHGQFMGESAHGFRHPTKEQKGKNRRRHGKNEVFHESDGKVFCSLIHICFLSFLISGAKVTYILFTCKDLKILPVSRAFKVLKH